jgi:hypothetical protein
LTSTTSTAIVVSPAPAATLVFLTQPGNAVVGSPLAPQPVLRTRDAFGNDSASGLGVSKSLALSLTSGAGSLLGTTTLDIGTAAGNGVATFTNLALDTVGTNKQLTASVSGLTSAISSFFTVTQANQTISFGPLPNKVYGDAPFTLSATASSGLPVTFSIVSGPATISGSTLTIHGTGTVIVRASQSGNSNWNPAPPVDQSFNVAKAPLTVTADSKVRVYGATNPVLTVTYSGFVNGENSAALSGAPNLSTTATSASPVAGSPYTISVSPGTLTASNYSFSFVNGSLTITGAVLTVKADNQTRPYGAPNPTFTASYSGFVNGENAGVLSGAPSFSTTATPASTVGGNSYTISADVGTLTASNYSFSFIDGLLTITQASVTNSVASSANPSLTGSNLTITATLAALAPSTAMPTGAVQFVSDGSPLGSPVALINGVATLVTAAMPHGSHIIAARYSSNENFAGSTNSLGSPQVINIPPTATLATYPRFPNTSLQIPISDLLSNYTSDADADVLALLTIGAGTNGATITVNGSFISYVPSTNSANPNSSDYFTYVVSDGFLGGTATNSILVSVINPGGQPIVTGLFIQTNGVRIVCSGVSGLTYHVERSHDLAVPGPSGWTDLGTVTMDNSGAGEFVDHSAPADKAFYRVVWKQ